MEDKIQDLRERFADCLAKISHTNVCVCIDWFELLFMDNPQKPFPVPYMDGSDENLIIDDDLSLYYTGGGSQHFKYIYHAMYKGEHLATILAYTRSPKFVKDGIVKVQFVNHLLYSADLWPFYERLVKTFGFIYKNISRLDLAMDGLDYLLEFMNLYHKQDRYNKWIELKGRANFNAKILDKNTMQSQNFFIGGSRGKKVCTIYNKSLEITKSGKDYIQKFWKKNGVIKDLLPLEHLQKTLEKEKIWLDGYHNVFRLELRVRGEIIQTIKGFTIEHLKTTDGIVSILKKLLEKFFEFVYLTDDRIARCNVVDLIPFDRFTIIPIEKEKKQKRDDLYKTKMSIHKNIKQLFTGDQFTDSGAVFEMLVFDIKKFELQNWFTKNIEHKWVRQYSPFCPDKERLEEITEFILSVQEAVNLGDNQQELFT